MKRILELFGSFFAGMVVTCIILSPIMYQMQKRIDSIRESQLHNSARTSIQLGLMNSKIDSLQANLKKYESTIKLSTRNIHKIESQIP